MGASRIAIWKGFISVFLGLMLALIGLDPMDATRRYTFDITDLDSGIPFVVTLIGLLAFTETLEKVNDTKTLSEKQLTEKRRSLPYSWKERWADLHFCWRIFSAPFWNEKPARRLLSTTAASPSF